MQAESEMALPLDDELKGIRDRRADAVRQQDDWSWRYMQAIGVANGSSLIVPGTMLGTAGFADHAARGLGPAAACFLIGLFAYSCGPLSRWINARAAAERFNQQERSIQLAYSRDMESGLWTANAAKLAEGKLHHERAKAYDSWAVWAMLCSWLASAATAAAWLAGVILVALAIYSGALKASLTVAISPPQTIAVSPIRPAKPAPQPRPPQPPQSRQAPAKSLSPREGLKIHASPHTILSWLAAAMAVVAAALWTISTLAYAPSVNTSGEGALVGGMIISQEPNGTRWDVVETLKLQSRWNKFAAMATAAAALLQAITLVV